LEKRIIVAIDGPAGSGKSTLARRIATRLGFVYIDTGAMYRAVALWASRNGTPLDDHLKLEALAESAEIGLTADNEVWLNGEDVSVPIRTEEISQAASLVSKAAGVRRALVAKQRAMAQAASVVMEGRDIGTVVFPEAQVKIFIDADPSVRSERRFRELQARGDGASPEQVAQRLAERDRQDSQRETSPLLQAPDAVYLDSTGLTIDQVEEAMLRIVREKTSNGKEVHR
jgi:cytidylate kinase